MRTCAVRLHRPLRGAAVAVLAAALVVSASGTARSSAVPSGTGAASLRFVPATLGVELPLADAAGVALGRLVMEAGTTADPVARLAFEGLGAAGVGTAPLGLSSANGDHRGGDERSADAAGVSALLRLVDYTVRADTTSALAQLGALEGAIDAPLGLGLRLQGQEVTTSVSATEAASSISLTISGVQLGLDDLLPADVLAGLPLGAVLDLVDGLDVAVPTDLANVVAEVDGVVATLREAGATAGDLAEVASTLRSAVGSDPTLAALQAAVDDAGADVTAAQAARDGAAAAVGAATAAVTAIEGELAALRTQTAGLAAEIATIESTIAGLEAEAAALLVSPLRVVEIAAELLALDAELAAAAAELAPLLAEVTALEGALAGARSALAGAQDDLAAAEVLLDQAETVLVAAEAALAAALAQLQATLVAELDALQQVLDDLLAELDLLLDGVDLEPVRLDLVELLTAAPLLDLGTLVLDLSTQADVTGSLGRATCRAADLEVLGVAVPTPDCAAIGAALGQLSGAIADVLGSLPVLGARPTVLAAGPAVTSSGAGSPDADGRSASAVDVVPLRLAIPAVSLSGVVDDLVAELDLLVSELLGSAAVGDAQRQVLGQLDATVAALPTGAALGGLQTTGLDVALAEIGLTSSFTAQQVGGVEPVPAAPGAEAPVAGAPGGSPAPVGVGSPPAPVPGTGSPAGAAPAGAPGDASSRSGRPSSVPGATLPRTGGDLATLVAAAVAALAAGSASLGVRRQLRS